MLILKRHGHVDVAEDYFQDYKISCGNVEYGSVLHRIDIWVSIAQNCLTYTETIDGISARSKIYNKMTQTLECKGVRDTIGYQEGLSFAGRNNIGTC